MLRPGIAIPRCGLTNRRFRDPPSRPAGRGTRRVTAARNFSTTQTVIKMQPARPCRGRKVRASSSAMLTILVFLVPGMLPDGPRDGGVAAREQPALGDLGRDAPSDQDST